MKRILAVLLALIMLLGVLTSCIEDTAVETEPQSESESVVEETTQAPALEYTSYDIASNKDKIHIQGRSMDTKDGPSFDWTASGIEFNATHEGYVCVSGKSTTGNVKFRVFVDGKSTGNIILGTKEALRKLPGTNVKEQTTQHIRLVRIEYVKDGLATMKAVELTGFISEWQEQRKFIEFIGDSITCGYGAVTNDSSKEGSKTFAYHAASQLNVDYSMVAISGIGVCKSTSQHSGRCISDFYKYNTWYRDSKTLYKPERKADLVVVNLNTNDNGHGATETLYKAYLKTLLSDIREIHGNDVNIVWIVGHMIDADSAVNKWLEAVFTEYGGESAGLYILKTTKNKSGGSGHPNYDSHVKTAEDLMKFIKEKNLL